MARVVQAAGRIIRTEADVGAIILVGRRFVRNEYVEMMPEGWRPVRSRHPDQDLEGHWPGLSTRA